MIKVRHRMITIPALYSKGNKILKHCASINDWVIDSLGSYLPGSNLEYVPMMVLLLSNTSNDIKDGDIVYDPEFDEAALITAVKESSKSARKVLACHPKLGDLPTMDEDFFIRWARTGKPDVMAEYRKGVYFGMEYEVPEADTLTVDGNGRVILSLMEPNAMFSKSAKPANNEDELTRYLRTCEETGVDFFVCDESPVLNKSYSIHNGVGLSRTEERIKITTQLNTVLKKYLHEKDKNIKKD